MAMGMIVIQMMKQNWSFWPLQITGIPNCFDEITFSIMEVTVICAKFVQPYCHEDGGFVHG